MPERKLYSIADFRGGLNVESAPDHVEDNQLIVARNVDLSERGGLKRRSGTERLATSNYSHPITQIIEFSRRDGSAIYLAMMNKILHQIAVDGSLTAIQTMQKEQVGYFTARNHLYILDGTDYYFYNGTDIQQVNDPDGPSVQAVTESIPVIDTGIGQLEGLEEGEYQCTYRYVFGYGSHNVTLNAYSIVQITRPNNAILWTNLPKVDPVPSGGSYSRWNDPTNEDRITSIEMWRSYPDGEACRLVNRVFGSADSYLDYLPTGFRYRKYGGSTRTIR